MSLHDSVERRRMAEPPVVACVAPSAQAPTLVLSIWQGQNWALPWSHLESAEWVDAKGDERLVMSFTKHRVTIRGENLRGLWDEVVLFRVGCLRELPAQYRAKVSAGAPFITQIEVEKLDRAGGESQ